MEVIITKIKHSVDFTNIQTQLKGSLMFWKTGQVENVHYACYWLFENICVIHVPLESHKWR